MNKEQAQFMALVQQLTSADSEIVLGKMMSSPGLKYKDKVFAFYHDKEMGFRLGPGFDPDEFGLKEVRPLSPFKTKPPLKGWFMVDQRESEHWEVLTNMALDFTMGL